MPFNPNSCIHYFYSEYTRVKENPHQNEHFKPWMEWAFQALGLDII